mgnify:CR=1 FL=1
MRYTSYLPLTNFSLLQKYIRKIFPLVDKELANWRRYAEIHSCPLLKTQALASIEAKRFHCLGGSIYCLYPRVAINNFVRLVVALQTISDYLDNLCDRAGVVDETAFRQLHLAMTESLDPETKISDYYVSYPIKNDGGYLRNLVNTCRQALLTLPSYKVVKPLVLTSASLYSELQTYKHLDKNVRETKMLSWINQHLPAYPQITPWEFAAATGSTLCIFTLCAAASDPQLTERQAQAIYDAYFPWINGLHILLDYFIDMVEDTTHNDLNFVAYYPDDSTIAARLNFFHHQSLAMAKQIPYDYFTVTVIHGLVALYLSDNKAQAPRERAIARTILDSAGNYTKLLYYICRALRFAKII